MGAEPSVAQLVLLLLLLLLQDRVPHLLVVAVVLPHPEHAGRRNRSSSSVLASPGLR